MLIFNQLEQDGLDESIDLFSKLKLNFNLNSNKEFNEKDNKNNFSKLFK